MGGVTACSNGSDDDETSVKLKGAFFEEGDDETPWVYCAEQLTEKENGIWEGEITSVNSEGWDHFGVEVNGTWYGAEEGLEGDITDAKLVKDNTESFWLATDKGGKTKVTIDLNKMTITVVDANPNDGDNDGSEDVEAVEFSYTYEASKISNTAASITITVTEITSTTDNAWEFWAITNASDKDEIKWKSGEGADAVYELKITDATKIAYVKEKGIAIKGAKGLSATVTVTTTEPTTTSPADGDDEKKEETPTLPTKVTLIDFVNGKYNDTKRETIMTKSATDENWTCELTVSDQCPNFNIKATFGENDALYKGGEVKLDESGIITKDGSNDIWCNVGKKCNGAKISVTVDFTCKEPNIKITLVEEGTEATTGGDEKPMPSWVGIEGNFLTGETGKWEYTKLEETATKGIWSATIENVTNAKLKFIIKAGDAEKIYTGKVDGWVGVTINGTAVPLVESDYEHNLYADYTIENSVNLKVTVDFTGEEPTVRLESVKEE